VRERRIAGSLRFFGPVLTLGRVPRLSKLMALAHQFEDLLRQGIIHDYASLSRLGQVSRARITQIMNLLHLSPEIQEAILFLPSTVQGRAPLLLSQVQPIAQVRDWQRQRALWRKLWHQKGTLSEVLSDLARAREPLGRDLTAPQDSRPSSQV
jgi:hypothetical protein